MPQTLIWITSAATMDRPRAATTTTLFVAIPLHSFATMLLTQSNALQNDVLSWVLPLRGHADGTMLDGGMGVWLATVMTPADVSATNVCKCPVIKFKKNPSVGVCGWKSCSWILMRSARVVWDSIQIRSDVDQFSMTVFKHVQSI